MLANWPKVFFTAVFCLLVGSVRAENKSNQVIRMGVSVGVTGTFSYVGNALKQGLQLAAEDINLKGGIAGQKLELLIEDNQNDPKTALSGVSKLIDQDKVDFVFSAFTHITQAIKAKVVSSKRPLIYQASILVTDAGEFVFQDYGDTEGCGAKLAAIANNLNYRRIAVFAENREFCDLVVSSFLRHASAGTQVVSQGNFNPAENDFRPLLLKLGASSPDAILACSFPQTGLLMRQLKELNLIRIPTLQFHAPFIEANDTSAIRALMEENKAVSTWYGFMETSATVEQKEFLKRYIDRFKQKPMLPESVYAYDDLMFAAAAVKACIEIGKRETSCYADYLAKSSHSGVAGVLKFNSDRRSNREVIAMKVTNGEWGKL